MLVCLANTVSNYQYMLRKLVSVPVQTSKTTYRFKHAAG